MLASPTVHSSRFLNEPGSAPAYSGVETQQRIRRVDRRAQRSDGRVDRHPLGVVVGVEVRQRRHPVVDAVSTPSGATSRAVRSSALFVEPARSEPEISRMRHRSAAPATG